MADGASFDGGPAPVGGRDGRFAAVVLTLVVAFLGLAVIKPWDSGAAPAGLASAGPSREAATAPRAPATAPPASPLAPTSAGTPPPDAAFVTGPPTRATQEWTGLRWRRLGSDDPLALVTSALRWRGGYVARGWVSTPEGLETPVWISEDGIAWDPLRFGTGPTFWPGALVVGLAEIPSGLVAITEQAAVPCPICAPATPPFVSWTSPDGRTWTPHPLEPVRLVGPAGTTPRLAVGPSGVVVASSGPGARLATSADGITWHYPPASALPAAFVLDDLAWTSTGFLAAGRWLGANGGRAAMFSSGDGRTWTPRPLLLPAQATPTSRIGTVVDTLVEGRLGVLAIGHAVTTLGGILWWQSSDGRTWHLRPGFGPLGASEPTASGAPSPNGVVVGDGDRILALRGGPDPGAWSSADGSSWRRLTMTGDLPGARAREAILLPGGVLLSDGSTSWYGEAGTG